MHPVLIDILRYTNKFLVTSQVHLKVLTDITRYTGRSLQVIAYVTGLRFLLKYYVSGLGDQWGPLIVNSLEKLNVSIVRNMDPVIQMCDREDRVVIGGSSNDGYKFSYVSEPNKYITSNAGEHIVHSPPNVGNDAMRGFSK